MWSRMEIFKEKDPTVLSTNQTLLIRKVLDGGYALLGDKTGFEMVMSKHCDLDMLKEKFIPQTYSPGLHNNSAYGFIISKRYVIF